LLLSISLFLANFRFMWIRIYTLSLIFCMLSMPCNAADPQEQTVDISLKTDAKTLTYLDAIILGVVEGITEYLPVSSTGHLILTNAALGLDSQSPVYKADGSLVMVGDEGEERPYTIGEAAYAYVIVIQAGAILAVILIYWRTLIQMLMGCLGKDPLGRRLAINLIIAFSPAVVFGLLLDDWIESMLGGNVLAVVGALVVGAIAMLLVERWRKRKLAREGDAAVEKTIYELTSKQALMIGFFQCFAMWPGTSRSLATIIGGYVAGLSPAKAAEFSFLLGLITLSAASGYKYLSDGSKMLEALSVGPVLLGCVVALVAALLSVKWLVGYLGRHGLALFAWYRIVLAVIVLIFIG
jgi:undecaprenyl-diphosphatase